MTAMSRTTRNKVVLVSALTAAVLGVAGLAALAVPAGAGTQPSLPDVSAEDLVSSALSARLPALAGTIQVDNALGLPAVPGLPLQVRNGNSQVRVWFDGEGRSRVSLPSDLGEQTMVDDGTTLWRWSSLDRTVTKITHPAGSTGHDEALDPATAANGLLALVRPTSTVSVDGTATVADRPAYQLVLAPAPTERTLLREVRVAIDAETRIPLRLEVLANGTNDPVFSIGFEQLSLGPQDPALFQFSPPAGATVTEPDVTSGRPAKPEVTGGPAAKPDGTTGPFGPFSGAEPTIVGDGWDTVIVVKLADGLLSGGGIPAGGTPGGFDPQGLDPKALLERFGTPVSGAWGSGRLISTAVLSVIITEDGRVAAGAVPQQVLIEALSR
ncbi:MAG TPA: outer membrane lipoprotein carrier protein LolA [Pseudonocardiaceae bacterium]